MNNVNKAIAHLEEAIRLLRGDKEVDLAKAFKEISKELDSLRENRMDEDSSAIEQLGSREGDETDE